MKRLVIRIMTGILAIASLAILSPGRLLADMPSTTKVVEQTPVGLVLMEDLQSGRSKTGDTVHYRTTANVYDKDHNLLVPANSEAFGTVTRSSGHGMLGKRGKLEFTCDYLLAPDHTHILLRGNKIGGTGKDNTGGMIAAYLLIGIFSGFISGANITIDKGTPIAMYVAADTQVPVAAATQDSAVSVKFTPHDKKRSPVTGQVTAFDGDSYTVKTDSGDETLQMRDIRDIQIEAAASPGTSPNGVSTSTTALAANPPTK